ncbi:MAG: hypothetical protein ACO3VH_07170 [Ilumatobacteraceae bacterium]
MRGYESAQRAYDRLTPEDLFTPADCDLEDAIAKLENTREDLADQACAAFPGDWNPTYDDVSCDTTEDQIVQATLGNWPDDQPRPAADDLRPYARLVLRLRETIDELDSLT